MALTNSDFKLQPKTAFDGPGLDLDFPGLRVGIAEYDEGPTGCTVFLFDRGWSTAVDARGGLVGTSGDYDFNHGLCFAGGSLLGLEAATGVTAELFDQRGRSMQAFPLVSGAIIFDFVARDNLVYPDRKLGRAAAKAAVKSSFPLGARGAGRSATVGKLLPGYGERSGQGAAVRRVGDVRVLVCTVVNAVGAALDREGNVVRGNLDRQTGRRLGPLEVLEHKTVLASRSDEPTRNTTLTLVLTNVRLDRRLLTQLGRQVHASMARAIQPFHTPSDGDVLYAVTSAEVDGPPAFDGALGIMASELAWDAVLAAVTENP